MFPAFGTPAGMHPALGPQLQQCCWSCANRPNEFEIYARGISLRTLQHHSVLALQFLVPILYGRCRWPLASPFLVPRCHCAFHHESANYFSRVWPMLEWCQTVSFPSRRRATDVVGDASVAADEQYGEPRSMQWPYSPFVEELYPEKPRQKRASDDQRVN